MKKSIGIKVLANACGVQPHSIRTWETRYNIFQPERNEGGQRLYSEDDIQKGKLISILLNDGHSISKIAGHSILELEKLVKSKPSNIIRDHLHTNISLGQLFKFLSSYDIDDVAKEIQYLRMNTSAKEFVFNVVLPVMQEIGLKVASGDYSVTQEHIVSTIVRDQLGQLSIPNIGDMTRRVALATPDGNLHELSILIADIICRSNRIPTSYLGASHPPECLSEALNALKVSTVVMGVVSSDKWSYDKSIVKYLKDLDKNLKISVEVVLGGGHDKEFPRFKNIKKVRVVPSFEIFDELLTNCKIGH